MARVRRTEQRHIDRPAVMRVSTAGDEPDMLLEERGAVPFKNTPVSDADAWDADAAIKRLRAWAGVDAEKPPTSAWAKYAQGFAWRDGQNPTDFGSYKLPHHDVVDGKLVLSRKGLGAAAARVDSTDIPEADRAAVKAHLDKHYHALGEEAPWEPEKRETPPASTDETQPTAPRVLPLKDATGSFRADLEARGPLDRRLTKRELRLDQAQQIVYGEVYVPFDPVPGQMYPVREIQDKVDTWGTFMRAATIEKLAHDYLRQARNVDVEHDRETIAGVPVESFIARVGDPQFTPGAWVLGVKCTPDVWQRIVAGELQGFSIDVLAGRAECAVMVTGQGVVPDLTGVDKAPYPAKQVQVNGAMTLRLDELVDPLPFFVSLVKKAANNREFELRSQERKESSMSEQAKPDPAKAEPADASKTGGARSDAQVETRMLTPLGDGAGPKDFGQLWNAEPIAEDVRDAICLLNDVLWSIAGNAQAYPSMQDCFDDMVKQLNAFAGVMEETLLGAAAYVGEQRSVELRASIARGIAANLEQRVGAKMAASRLEKVKSAHQLAQQALNHLSDVIAEVGPIPSKEVDTVEKPVGAAEKDNAGGIAHAPQKDAEQPPKGQTTDAGKPVVKDISAGQREDMSASQNPANEQPKGAASNTSNANPPFDAAAASQKPAQAVTADEPVPGATEDKSIAQKAGAAPTLPIANPVQKDMGGGALNGAPDQSASGQFSAPQPADPMGGGADMDPGMKAVLQAVLALSQKVEMLDQKLSGQEADEAQRAEAPVVTPEQSKSGGAPAVPTGSPASYAHNPPRTTEPTGAKETSEEPPFDHLRGAGDDGKTPPFDQLRSGEKRSTFTRPLFGGHHEQKLEEQRKAAEKRAQDRVAQEQKNVPAATAPAVEQREAPKPEPTPVPAPSGNPALDLVLSEVRKVNDRLGGIEQRTQRLEQRRKGSAQPAARPAAETPDPAPKRERETIVRAPFVEQRSGCSHGATLSTCNECNPFKGAFSRR